MEHHAYLVEAGLESVRDELFEFIEKEFGVKKIGNPDFWVGEFDVFGIGEGRALRDMQLRRSSAGGTKIFVVGFNFITREAQNSLLKVFEEPAGDTHFFIVTPNTDAIVPTLLSRLSSLRISSRPDLGESGDALAKRFLTSNPSKRLALLKEMIDEKDKAKAILFLNSLEKALHGDSKIQDKESVQALEDIMRARIYMKDRAPSIKLLLEQVALSVPSDF